MDQLCRKQDGRCGSVLIDSEAMCHVTYKDQALQNRLPSKSMVYMADSIKAEFEATGDLSLKVCDTEVMLNLSPVHYMPSFKKHIHFYIKTVQEWI